MGVGDDIDLDQQLTLTPFEAEHYIESLEPVTLEEIGTKKFLDLHEKVDKLSVMVITCSVLIA